MRKIHLVLIVIAALWNVLPAGSPFHSLFERVVEDPFGGVLPTGDPEVDPIMINTPPPRRQ
jgi:hypothetical protein